MKICLDCGLTPEAHHEFREHVAPAGCTCDQDGWTVDVIPPACGSYLAPRRPLSEVDDYCATCEHDKACHGGSK